MSLNDYLDSDDFKKFKQQMDKLTGQTSLLHAMGNISAVAEKLGADMAGAKKDHSTMFISAGSFDFVPLGNLPPGKKPDKWPRCNTYAFHRFYGGEHFSTISTVTTCETPFGYWTKIVGGPLDGERVFSCVISKAIANHKEFCIAVRQIKTG